MKPNLTEIKAKSPWKDPLTNDHWSDERINFNMKNEDFVWIETDDKMKWNN